MIDYGHVRTLNTFISKNVFGRGLFAENTLILEMLLNKRSLTSSMRERSTNVTVGRECRDACLAFFTLELGPPEICKHFGHF